MNINPINACDCNLGAVNKNTTPNFGHGKKQENNYKTGQKALILGTTILGVAGSLALLAKHEGYSLNIKRMFKNIKNSYLAKKDFEAKEVIAMGAGSCIGGLAGGCLVDKNKQNRKSKLREAVMQIGNVSIPILTVDLLVAKLFKNKSDGFRAFAGLAGVFAGIAISNVLMNKLSNLIFKEGKESERGMKITDFLEHPDDVVVAASYISKKDFVHAIGRIIPIALTIPGWEVGNRTANHN